MTNDELKHQEADKYTSGDIQVLEGLQAVRLRPGMYIGTTSAKGLHHLVWEIVDNSIDEVLAGFATTVTISIDENEVVTVEDDGRGMPVGIHPKTGISTVETIFTVLHAGGKFGGGAYKVSGGLHGVGASVVNALSEWLEVKVYRDGNVYFTRFENGGKPAVALNVIDHCDINKTGSLVRFKADKTIFKEGTVYDYQTLYERFRQIAFLNKGIRLVFNYKNDETKNHVFHYEGGLKEYIAFLNENKTVLHPEIIYCDEVDEATNISVEIAMQYNDSYSSSIHSFCNNINTGEGGTHEEGFALAINRVFNAYARDNNLLKKDDDNLTTDDLKEGLTALISIKHPDPQYEGQTKGKLGNAEVRKIVSSLFGEYLGRFLLENPEDAHIIIDKAVGAAKARIAAKKARDLTRRKNVLEISSLPGKLVDCSSRDASISEIYIVEGNSAGGSAKMGRDSKFQAILPLRGKILNVEKAKKERIYDNAEIRSMITAFGCGIGEEIDLEKLRYHKIVIMTDADVDGAHICTLILTFLYRFLRPVIEGGYVYIAMPPLYKLYKGQKALCYCYTDEELEEAKERFAGERFDIQRYKGLGEMDPEQLWETTLDPNVRTLKKVTIQDAEDADQVFEMLMGDDVDPRRDFIIKNAHFVKNLDI